MGVIGIAQTAISVWDFKCQMDTIEDSDIDDLEKCGSYCCNTFFTFVNWNVACGFGLFCFATAVSCQQTTSISGILEMATGQTDTDGYQSAFSHPSWQYCFNTAVWAATTVFDA